VSNLSAGYGTTTCIESLDIRVPARGIVTLLGANGAGKTTLLRSISGMLPIRSGSVLLDGKSITGLAPDQVLRRGVAHVPEGRQIFRALTVRENLQIGAYVRSHRSEVERDVQMMYRYFPILSQRASQLAGQLSGGEQQMLAISRGLMSNPRVLLLDEPSLGLSPRLSSQIFEILGRLRRERGVAILLVEQNARLALDVSDYAYVLNAGRVEQHGPSRELRETPSIAEHYLGA
jgi:branched-chain amino acid transport system ATP-binding protein